MTFKLFHYRDRGSFLNKMNPLLKLILLICLCAADSRLPYLYVFGISALLAVLWILTKIPVALIFKNGLFFMFIAVFIAVTEYINTQSMLSTCTETARYLNYVAASLIFTDCTSAFDLSRAFGSGKVGITVGLTLKMVPLITDCITSAMTARRARGASFFRNPVKSISGTCICVMNTLLNKVQDYSNSLAARGFGEEF